MQQDERSSCEEEPVAGSSFAPVAIVRRWCAADVTVGKCIVVANARWKHGVAIEERLVPGIRQPPADGRCTQSAAAATGTGSAGDGSWFESRPGSQINQSQQQPVPRRWGNPPPSSRPAENCLPLLRKTCLRLRSPRPNSPASSGDQRKSAR